MKKNASKILSLLLVVLAIFCLQTAVLAAEEEAPAADCQILGPLGASDLDGNLVITTDGTELILEADFGTNSLDTLAWDVISGKDILAIHNREGYPGQAIASPLDNGEATVIAYLEDGSQVSATKKIIVSNQTPEAAATYFTLSFTLEGEGKIETGTGTMSASTIKQYAPGTVLDFTAVETSMPFKYWVVRHGTDKDIIVSKEENYKFTLASDMTVAAIYDQSDEGTYVGTNAAFIHGNIVAADMYVKTMTKNAPDAPYQRNMTFSKWISEQVDVDVVLADKKLAKGELTEATTFTATYTQKDTEFNITVIGGSGSGTYAYGEAVTATVTATPEEGKQFLFWSKDGAPVSYDTTYKFSAMQDCTVVAVFGDAIVTDGINMVMQTPVVEGNVIAFTFERYVPENYDFVSSGFIVSQRSDDVRGSSSVLMEAVSYRDGVRTQFTKSLKKQSGTYYARGYVVYMEDGAVKTIYSETQKIVVE